MPDREISTAELQRLTPKEYLKKGYCGAAGRPDPKLLGIYAAAACAQLEASQTSPQELAGTFEALRQALPWHKEADPHERMRNAVDEALELASSMYNQPNNPGIVRWLDECVDAIRTQADSDAFLAHLTSVVRQYSLIVAMRNL